MNDQLKSQYFKSFQFPLQIEKSGKLHKYHLYVLFFKSRLEIIMFCLECINNKFARIFKITEVFVLRIMFWIDPPFFFDHLCLHIFFSEFGDVFLFCTVRYFPLIIKRLRFRSLINSIIYCMINI